MPWREPPHTPVLAFAPKAPARPLLPPWFHCAKVALGRVGVPKKLPPPRAPLLCQKEGSLRLAKLLVALNLPTLPLAKLLLALKLPARPKLPPVPNPP